MVFFKTILAHPVRNVVLPLAFSVFFLYGCAQTSASANAFKMRPTTHSDMGPGHKTEQLLADATQIDETKHSLRTTRIKKEAEPLPPAPIKITPTGDRGYNRTIRATKLENTVQSIQPQRVVSETQIITNEKYSVAIVPASKLDVAFFENGMSAQEFIKTHPDVAVAVSGGYYDILPNGHYCPVGLLVSSGVLRFKSSLSVADGKDELRIPFAPKAKKESEWYTSFFVNTDAKAGILPIWQLNASTNGEYDDLKMGLEAGPSILKDGIIDTTEISKRATGGRPDLRQIIGICDNGDAVLFSSTVPMTLYDVANEMKALGAVDAMALDGGPETAFAAPGNPGASIDGISTFMIIYAKR